MATIPTREVLVPRSPSAAPRVAALISQGYVLAYEVVRVERDLAAIAADSPMLRFQALPEVGATAFRQVFAAALAGTSNRFTDSSDPDVVWERLVQRSGSSFDPWMWRIASLDAGPIGVVMPRRRAQDPDEGGMSFVGLVPSARGRRLGGPLHRAGLEILAAAGASRYVDHTDVENRSMIRVFRRNGCRVAATIMGFVQRVG